MYVSVSRLRVRPERATDLIEAFQARAHLVDGFDGFQGLEVWQASRDASEVLMVIRDLELVADAVVADGLAPAAAVESMIRPVVDAILSDAS